MRFIAAIAFIAVTSAVTLSKSHTKKAGGLDEEIAEGVSDAVREARVAAEKAGVEAGENSVLTTAEAIASVQRKKAQREKEEAMKQAKEQLRKVGLDE